MNADAIVIGGGFAGLSAATALAAQGKRVLDVSDLPIALRQQRTVAAQDMNLTVGMSMGEIERAAIEATLRSVGYDKQRAAKILGIGLRTLYRKQKEYGL